MWAQVSRHLPAWVVGVVSALLLAAWLTSQIKPLVPIARWMFRPLLRLFGRGGVNRELVKRRRTLVTAVARQLEILADDTRWDDRRYTELQAEVEIEGREMVLPWWRHSPERTVAKRSVPSLTRALARSLEKIVVLQGEPGSGKSVALRHLARELASRAAREADPRTPVPLYLDLKTFRPDGPVTPDAVGAFVLHTLRGIGDRRISDILDQDFDAGLADGRWLLLFDSFDEIPAVLAATESDKTVRAYADAIITYVRLGACRAVIASREWRGPPTFQVRCFTIKRLSLRQQRTMIRRSGLDTAMRQVAVAGITRPEPALRPMIDNPLFLWLLCDYLGRERVFPDSVHAVFDSYVNNRLTADTHRTTTQYGLGPETLRAYAEEIAFCIAARPDLGLEPTRTALRAALAAEGRLGLATFDQALDALTKLRLGRDPATDHEPEDRRFTFTHRRLQEYFATCMVLRAPDRTAPSDLLSDGHWREVTIALLQTQPAETTAPLLAAAEEMLASKVTAPDESPESSFGVFAWPPGLLHLLEVVTIGLNRVPDRIPPAIRELTGPLLDKAWREGRRHDRLWVLGVVLAAPRDILLSILTHALDSTSAMLREVAYRHASWLPALPTAMRIGIRRTLFAMWSGGQLRTMAPMVRAQLQRLRTAPDLLAVYRLLRLTATIDLALLAALGALVGNQLRPADGRWWPLIVLGAGLAHLGLLLRANGLGGTDQSDQRPNFYVSVRWLTRSALANRIIGRVLRLAVAGLAITAVIRIGHASPLLVTLDCLAVGYGICWADAAMDQVVLGGRITMRNWPLLPFLWALRRREGPGILDERISSAAEQIWDFAVGFGIIGFIGGVMAGVFFLVIYLAKLIKIDVLLKWIWHPFGIFFGWIGSWFSHLHFPSWLRWILLAPVFVLEGVVALIVACAVLYTFFSPFWDAATTAVSNRRVLRSAVQRTTPYTAHEIIDALNRIGTGLAVRDFVRVLRETPALCSHEALAVLSDVATAAADGGHQRYKAAYVRKGRTVRSAIPARVAVPPGSSPAFITWTQSRTTHAADLLLRIDEDTIDEITRLVAEHLRPRA